MLLQTSLCKSYDSYRNPSPRKIICHADISHNIKIIKVMRVGPSAPTPAYIASAHSMHPCACLIACPVPNLPAVAHGRRMPIFGPQPMSPNFLPLKPFLGTLELPWKFGDNPFSRSRVISLSLHRPTYIKLANRTVCMAGKYLHRSLAPDHLHRLSLSGKIARHACAINSHHVPITTLHS